MHDPMLDSNKDKKIEQNGLCKSRQLMRAQSPEDRIKSLLLRIFANTCGTQRKENYKLFSEDIFYVQPLTAKV